MNQQIQPNSQGSSRRGSALLTVVVILITLSALAVSMTNLTVMGVREQVKRYDKVSLLVSAESAVNMAISDLQRNYDARISSSLTADMEDGGSESLYTHDVDLAGYGLATLNAATLEAKITRLSTDPDNKGTPDWDPNLIYFLVQGTATIGDPSEPMHYRRTRVEATVLPSPQTVFKQTLFALEGYDFKGSATTDSWDSSVASYDSTATGAEGDLASEGDIDVQKTENVKGEVLDNQEMPLPLFDYDEQVGSVASAGVLNDYYVKTTGFTHITGAQWVLPLVAGGSYRFDSLNLTANSELRLSGTGTIRLLIDGGVNFNGATITYTESPNTILKIYQGRDGPGAESNWDINTGQMGDVDTSGTGVEAYPRNLIVMSEYDGHITMNGNGIFCGVFFVPNATIKFNGTFDFYGSVVAKRFDTTLVDDTEDQGRVNGNFAFHYDESLEDLDLGLTARLTMVGWRSYDLGYNFSD